ncbi:MAG: DoxX family protein [Actinobacteria bacterium]|nr:DoxX family protein [Actinomycetota bacterium]
MRYRSTADSIDSYIAEFPPETRAVLEEVRALIKAAAPDATETISYAIPTFDLNGKHLVHFAGYAKHIGFYPVPSGLEAFTEELKAYKRGKGSVQFPLDRPMPADLIRRIVEFRVAENNTRGPATVSRGGISSMNKLLWLLQIVLAVYFFSTGVIHFILPAGLPAAMSWMYDLSTPLHVVSGGAEILAAIGLIVPAVTRIMPRLTPLAATGLMIVMVLAAVFHFGRAEYTNIVMNLVVAGVAGFVAYGRWRLSPIE